RITVIVFPDAFIGKFPVLNPGAFFAFAHLSTQTGSLFIRQPAWIGIVLAHQIQGINAPIAFLGRRVMRKRQQRITWLPWFLPRRYALFQLCDQTLSDLFMVGFSGFVH